MFSFNSLKASKVFGYFLGNQMRTLRRKKLNEQIRGGSRTAATSNMECFVIIVNDFKPLTIITKRSILDVTAALYPPLKRKSLQIANTRKPVLKAPKTVHRGACFEESRKSTVYNFTTEWLEHKTEKLAYFSSVFISSYHLIHKMIAAYLSSYITF